MSDNGNMERGTPSPGLSERLKEAKSISEGGVLDDSPGYEPITIGTPERGVYKIVGGYLEEFADGRAPVLHNEVEMRAMSGHEEDLLSNDAVPFFRRMTGILAQCCVRIGTMTSRPEIIRAINGLPAGSRQHLLVCLRRTSHWRVTKDIYDMTVECPKCEKDSSHKVNLSELELFESADPFKRVFEETLPESGQKVVWHVTKSEEDEIISAVVKNEQVRSELLTWSILIRVKSLNDMPITVRADDCVDPNTGNLKKPLPAKILELRQALKNLSTGDRQYLRDRFMENEPGIDTDLDFTCGKCRKEFSGRLDLGQRSFFFPSETRTRSNKRSFT